MAGTLVKTVSIDIGVKGDQDSKAKLDAINARAEELKKAFPEYTLKIDSAAATERLAIFRGQVKATADAVTKPMDPVILTDKAKAKLEEIRLTAERLKATFPDFTVRINDGEAKAKLALFAAEAKVTTDRIDRELGSAGSGGGGIISKLLNVFSTPPSNPGSPASSSASGLLGNPVGQGIVGAGLPIALGLVPGVVGAGIGGAVGLGGIGISALFAGQAATLLKADQAALNAATTKMGKLRATTQLQQDTSAFAPFTGLMANLKTLVPPLMGIIAPFAKALTPIIAQLRQFEQAIGPQLSAMFTASIPFVKAFLAAMEQGGKSLIPAFTQAMTTMVKSGALKEMTQGLVYLVQGLAGFTKALGPGMRASGQIFERVALGVKGAMIGIGVIVSTVARVLEFNWPKALDNMRHSTAVIFDGIRGDIAHVWDMIWNNTVGREQRGIADVIGWLKGMPGRMLDAFKGIGSAMWNMGSFALSQLWNGLKSAGHGIIGWLENFAHSVVSTFKKIWGWFSPSSVMFEGGKSLMEGLAAGIKAHAHKAISIAAAAGTGITGAFSGSVRGEQKYAESLFGHFGWGTGQLGPLIALWNQESGWNPLAMNASSGAFGIAQALGHGLPGTGGRYGNQYPSKAANEGNAGAQIAWGLGYIRSAYGSPAGAWAHEVSQGWYDRGGWLMPGLTLAMNNTGYPEQVIPHGRGGGIVIQNLSVNLPHGSDREQGQRIVEAIRKYEQGSGSSWRK